MKPIAVLYWGLIRSLREVYPSHVKYVFTPLSEHSSHEIFVHTWMTPRDVQRVWQREVVASNHPSDAAVLRATRLLIDDQSVFMRYLKVNWKQFTNNRSNWDRELQENHLCALESLQRGFDLFDAEKYSYVVFMRPDMKWFNVIPFPDKNETTRRKVVLPLGERRKSDRFAIFPAELAHIYARRFKYVAEFARNHRVVAEDLLMYALSKHPTLEFTYFKESAFLERVRPK